MGVMESFWRIAALLPCKGGAALALPGFLFENLFLGRAGVSVVRRAHSVSGCPGMRRRPARAGVLGGLGGRDAGSVSSRAGTRSAWEGVLVLR